MIALDARMVGHSGIGTYIRGLFSGMTPEQLSQMCLMGDPAKLPAGAGKVIPAFEPIYGLREQFLMPRRLRSVKADVLHVPHYNIPLAHRGPLVVTVHDIIHLLFPEFSRLPLARYYADCFLSQVSRRADRILADSHCTKEDLVRFGVPEKKIDVVYLAIEEKYRPVSKAETDACLRRYGLAPGYFLYVGNLRPIKNIPRILEAYRLLTQRRKDVPPLVMAGRDQMRNLSAETKNNVMIKFTGEVRGEDLPALFSGASAFLFPSLYEGFGLPPLEAMASGCPVVASQAGSLKEMLGDAALPVDPKNVPQMSDALERIILEPALRRELIEKGFRNTQRFSWKKTAEAVFKTYKEVSS
jgi:glycosyltransferase involved in cell wall biosynthesis